MIYIIAGTREQAMNWQREHMKNRHLQGETVYSNEYMYVYGPDVFRGVKNPHGVFMGSWRHRPDIIEIVRTIRIQTDLPTPRALDRIWESLKPRPKITPRAGGWIDQELVLEQAAKNMADDIDQQLLTQVSKSFISTENMMPSIIKAIQELNGKVTALEQK
jgi:hypothetical protein